MRWAMVGSRAHRLGVTLTALTPCGLGTIGRALLHRARQLRAHHAARAATWARRELTKRLPALVSALSRLIALPFHPGAHFSGGVEMPMANRVYRFWKP